ncbi:uncharacterized protein LOC126891790 [Diabrotica virgifera virgifera]|uniref:Uncharacterized protein n=1 Tax=Diabrotica virgifera virgifera TaxID=50390 RepID=A0ABM5L3K0_DIAVI|nr:uncharacterized protein LOC126891790 [Diabrotica virgifera virgifera]
MLNPGELSGVSSGSSSEFHVSTPEAFNFSNPASWSQWRKRFERYAKVSGLSTKSDSEKIDALLYIMGEKSEEILLQMQKLPTVYDDMIQALESHFIPRRNIIFERFQFNSRVQLPGENIGSFIAAVHTLAANCNFGVLKEEFIRDRIVVNMLDKKISEKMQFEAKLILSDAILYARQAELQSQQNSVLQQQQSSLNVIAKQENTPKSFNTSKRPQHPEVKCKYCGLAQYKQEICPARRSTCRGCGRFGHWDRV